MNEIQITVADKIAKGDGACYVCGNGDYLARFVFDEEWEQYPTKTARFVTSKGQYTDVVFHGNTCRIPVMFGTGRVYIGVFVGDLKTSTPAEIRAKRSILDLGGIPKEPDSDVYGQIMEKLNSLEKGLALPAGGIQGQVLCKQSEEDYDISWRDLPRVEKTSQLINDSGYISDYTETDPTVPAWAKAASKPTYTAGEVGADAAGMASSIVTAHNGDTEAHPDIWKDIETLSVEKVGKKDLEDLVFALFTNAGEVAL